MGPETGIISFQNGVQKDDMLRPIFGDKALMGGVAYVGTTIGRPGVIAADRTAAAPGVRRIRRPPLGARRDVPRRLQDAAASMPSSATTSAARSGRNSWCWSRCPARPRRCATPSGRSARNPLTREFLLDLAREVVAVGRAHGVNLPADYRRAAHSVLRRLAAGDDDVDASRPAAPASRSRCAGSRAAWSISAQQVGVPTPMNRAVRDILTLHADGRAAG